MTTSLDISSYRRAKAADAGKAGVGVAPSSQPYRGVVMFRRRRSHPSDAPESKAFAADAGFAGVGRSGLVLRKHPDRSRHGFGEAEAGLRSGRWPRLESNQRAQIRS